MRALPLAQGSRLVAALGACAWMALCCAIHSPSAAAADDAAAIRTLIGATWDTPGSAVETNPVVVSGSHAVASWTQGEKGGRALLRLDAKGWSVVLCSGDPLRDKGWLTDAGVPAADAEAIARDLAAAELLVPEDRRAKFSLFAGVVEGDSDAHGHAGHDETGHDDASHDHSGHDKADHGHHTHHGNE